MEKGGRGEVKLAWGRIRVITLHASGAGRWSACSRGKRPRPGYLDPCNLLSATLIPNAMLFTLYRPACA